MAICAATMHAKRDDIMWPGELSTVAAHVSVPTMGRIVYNTAEENLGVVGSYQKIYKESDEDLLAYFHDDVVVYERGWDQRVLQAFEDEQVGVVGFGGALWHGTDGLYKVPYRLQQLARFHYYSNTRDAETHGERFTGERDVAVLDGFVLIVRRRLLDRCGGWPDVAGGFHCYDYAICALAHRYGYRVRLVGVDCHHLGGRTSTTEEYQEWAKGRGVSDAEAHEKSHRWFYDEFKDVMPWRCG